jgi:catechol 2,3-dioxygenase-like lactoylglutathione lyase family enzyme
MTIVLNHTIVAAKNKRDAARWFAGIFGLPFDEAEATHFAPVRINDSLTLLFDDERSFPPSHYSFHVNDAEFDAIFKRMQASGVKFGSAPGNFEDGELNHWNGGRGVYFRSPDGHVLELMTVAQ